MEKATIYKLTDVETKKCYIGSTKIPLSYRFNIHRCVARKGAKSKLSRHVREVLGTEFSREEYESRFKIEQIDYIETEDPDKPAQLEMFYIAKFDSFRNGYNSTPTGTSGTETKSESHKRKISESHQGKVFSEETRKRMSKAKQGSKCTHWNFKVETELLVEMYGNGMSYRQIGEEVGMSISGVRNRIKKYG